MNPIRNFFEGTYDNNVMEIYFQYHGEGSFALLDEPPEEEVTSAAAVDPVGYIVTAVVFGVVVLGAIILIVISTRKGKGD